ncbi:NADPH-dependent 2,4-dienoyl-CoA reductase/sulfur reductase-like enzyme [Actinocorallia herbida]|uniref:NADPH-dependent 2,4-dienoyl-CoA reductase/sulfur reductase-like enzyme n=1 Tax=Actinocorallia herbida TaxID=58109 RepID=A0A3N1D5E0_9ACTN|nr:FAD-dependent oxidoreductase [Actinocorallia herbida]ROO88676.1 NADPH-dependent 2,4-dienoyl-CoA reductase/sulfur reductase-like enzyme [Actinocorallia herbida]
MSAEGIDRVVIVGASLAGLRAAEALRDEGFTGRITLIGDEAVPAYDRPPLSKQVLLGQVAPEATALPHTRDIDARWRLGVAATGLDLSRKTVLLADGTKVPFDRLLIATGTRARPWINEAEARLEGVLTLRTAEDAEHLSRLLDAGPRRVVVVGAGFTGSEIASACRERGIEVTVAERGAAPLVGALGGVVGDVAARLQRAHGVDLRCGVTVTSLEGDEAGRLRRAHLSDGTVLDADVAVIALGALRNTGWLEGSGLAAGPRGIAADAACRAFDHNGIATDDIFVAGDVARMPHALFGYQFLSLEHWGNAVEQARLAAHNMLAAGPDRRPHLWIPAFWSSQFGVSIKSVGVPTMGDEVVVTQGSLEEGRFAAVYGHRGRVIAAVSFDHGRWLDHYTGLIESAAPFPPVFTGVDRPPPGTTAVSAGFPDPSVPSHGPTVTVSGYAPSERRITFTPAPA